MQTQTQNVPAIYTADFVADDGEQDRILSLEAKRTLAGYKATVSRLECKDDDLSAKTRQAARAAIAKLVGAFPDLDGTIGRGRNAGADKVPNEQRAVLSLRAIRATITRKLAKGDSEADVASLRRREQSLLADYPDLGKKSAEKTGDAKVDMLVLRAGMRNAAVANKAAIDAALQAALGSSPASPFEDPSLTMVPAALGPVVQGMAIEAAALTIDGTAEVVEDLGSQVVVASADPAHIGKTFDEVAQMQAQGVSKEPTSNIEAARKRLGRKAK